MTIPLLRILAIDISVVILICDTIDDDCVGWLPVSVPVAVILQIIVVTIVDSVYSDI